MVKYINYNEISNTLKEFINKDRDRKIQHCWSTNQVLEILNRAAETESMSIEIIRCKDCKHFSEKPDYCHKLAVDVEHDFWCKHGEKNNNA